MFLFFLGAESFIYANTNRTLTKTYLSMCKAAECSSCRKEKGNVNYDDLFNEISMADGQV